MQLMERDAESVEAQREQFETESDRLTINECARLWGLTWGRTYQIVVLEHRIPSEKFGARKVHTVSIADAEAFAALERRRGRPRKNPTAVELAEQESEQTA